MGGDMVILFFSDLAVYTTTQQFLGVKSLFKWWLEEKGVYFNYKSLYILLNYFAYMYKQNKNFDQK